MQVIPCAIYLVSTVLWFLSISAASLYVLNVDACGRHVVVNTCICANGVAETGAYCPVNGAAKCASCASGWKISADRTYCICTFILCVIK